MQRTGVILPGYNVAQTIGPLIRRIRAMGLDVVMMDDGSTDHTAKTAAEAGARVISHVRNQGKGSALRDGFAYALQAGYDLVITLDSDGQHDPQDIPRLLEVAQRPQAGLVIGDRLADGMAAAMPRIRRWTNRAMSAIVSAVARQPIPDSQSGFRVIPKTLLCSVALSARRFDIETELVLAAARAGWTVTSVPIRVLYGAQRSRIRPVRDGARFIRLIVRYLWRPQSPARHGL